MASLRASLSLNKQDQISALFSEIKSLKDEIWLLSGIIRSFVRPNAKVMCTQETQTACKFTDCGAESKSSDAHFVEKEDKEDAQTVVEEKEENKGISNTSRFLEAAGITNNCAQMNFAFNEEAYVIKVVPRNVPLNVVMNWLHELKVFCSALQ